MDPRPDDILRLFYGVLLPAEAQQEVAALQAQLSSVGVRVKWVEPDNLHLTLKFLGELPGLVVHDLKLLGHRLASELSPWDVALQGVGAFPKLSQPQTLWVGVGPGAESLDHLGRVLNQQLEDEMIAGGDRKPFHAHCTVGRVRQERGLRALTEGLRQGSGFTGSVFHCDSFQLLSSTLSASGPTYSVLAEFHLGRRG